LSSHPEKPSPAALTYTARPPLGIDTLTCTRCGRVYPYPHPGSRAIRCECGWRYQNVGGLIEEEFKPRIGV
jgi:hypothetical protein